MIQITKYSSQGRSKLCISIYWYLLRSYNHACSPPLYFFLNTQGGYGRGRVFSDVSALKQGDSPRSRHYLMRPTSLSEGPPCIGHAKGQLFGLVQKPARSDAACPTQYGVYFFSYCSTNSCFVNQYTPPFAHELPFQSMPSIRSINIATGTLAFR